MAKEKAMHWAFAAALLPSPAKPNSGLKLLIDGRLEVSFLVKMSDIPEEFKTKNVWSSLGSKCDPDEPRWKACWGFEPINSIAVTAAIKVIGAIYHKEELDLRYRRAMCSYLASMWFTTNNTAPDEETVPRTERVEEEMEAVQGFGRTEVYSLEEFRETKQWVDSLPKHGSSQPQLR